MFKRWKIATCVLSTAAVAILPASATYASGKSEIAVAKAVAAAAEKPPSALGAGITPVPRKPPAGKTIVFIACTDVPTCAVQSQATQEAATAIGWNFKELTDNDANPATLITALTQALQYHPVAVGFVGLPEALWSSMIPVYAKAGVVLLPTDVGPVTINKTVPANLAAAQTAPEGTAMADWVIANSNGHANVVLLTIPSYQVLMATSNPFLKAMSKCSRCKVTTINATIPQVDAGQANSLIVSALQRNRSVDYVVSTFGAFTDGLPAALSAANLAGRVKIASASADVGEQQDIVSGTESMGTTYGYKYTGWLGVDAAVRHVEGVKMSVDYGGVPFMLLTKANLKNPATSFDLPANYQKLFKKDWKVGK